jgi:hypothetical protein
MRLHIKRVRGIDRPRRRVDHERVQRRREQVRVDTTSYPRIIR